MQILNFTCKEQILTAECPSRLVIAKSKQHVFAQFALDEEWDGLSVTVVFRNDFVKQPYKKPLTAEPMEIPPEVLVQGSLRVSLEGLKNGGDYRLTTKYMCNPLTIHRSGDIVGIEPGEETPELWEQVLAIIGPLAELDTLDKSSIVAAINEVYRTGGGGGSGGGVPFDIDNHTLVIENGVMRVNTANDVQQDNTQPITSAAVYTTVGNISAILDTI